MTDPADRRGFSRAAGALAGALCLAPFIGIAGAVGLPALVGVAGAAAALSRRARGLFRTAGTARVLTGAVALLLCWAITTNLWSATPEWEISVQLASTTLFGALLAQGAGAGVDRDLARRAMVACTLALVLLLAMAAASDNAILRAAGADDEAAILRNSGRGAAFAVMLAWGAAVCLERLYPRRRLWLLVIAGTGLISFAFDMTANAVAFGAGLVCFIAAAMAPRLMLSLGFALAAASVALAPLLYDVVVTSLGPSSEAPLTWAIRLEMWNFALDRIAERPVLGWGFGGSRAFDAPVTVQGVEVTQLLLHPHAAGLQIWLETGGVGAGLAALALLAGGGRAARALAHDRLAAGAAGGTLAAAAVLAGVSYSAYQVWMWAALALAVAGVVAARQTRAEAEPQTWSGPA